MPRRHVMIHVGNSHALSPGAFGGGAAGNVLPLLLLLLFEAASLHAFSPFFFLSRTTRTMLSPGSPMGRFQRTLAILRRVFL